MTKCWTNSNDNENGGDQNRKLIEYVNDTLQEAYKAYEHDPDMYMAYMDGFIGMLDYVTNGVLNKRNLTTSDKQNHLPQDPMFTPRYSGRYPWGKTECKSGMGNGIVLDGIFHSVDDEDVKLIREYLKVNGAIKSAFPKSKGGTRD